MYSSKDNLNQDYDSSLENTQLKLIVNLSKKNDGAKGISSENNMLNLESILSVKTKNSNGYPDELKGLSSINRVEASNFGDMVTKRPLEG